MSDLVGDIQRRMEAADREGYAGRRVPAGRLNGIQAPPGTILGPKAVTREYVVVTHVDPRGVDVGYARPEDLVAAARHCEPRSITEARLRGRLNQSASAAVPA